MTCYSRFGCHRPSGGQVQAQHSQCCKDSATKQAVYESQRIAVVIPAHNEEKLILATLRGIPPFVDEIVLVDDHSDDRTQELVENECLSDPRIHYIRHHNNRGVGAALATGYQKSLELNVEWIAVMAGDDQMDPRDLSQLLDACLLGADYVKGNRLLHPEVKRMPLLRRLGSQSLAWLTRCTTGLKVHDTQCGYTVISAKAARRIDWAALWPRYGYPNDILSLAAHSAWHVAERPVRPVYKGESSGLRPKHFFQIAGLILRWRRLRGPVSVSPRQ